MHATSRRLPAALLACALSLAPIAASASQATLVTPGSPLPMTGLASFLNSALLSLGSCNSGPSAPTNGTGAAAFAGECWINTTANPWVVSLTPDGTHWSEIGTLNTSTYVWTPYSNTYAISLGGALTTAGALTQAGAYATTITVTGATNATLPAGTHTLGGLDVSQTWSGNNTFSATNNFTGTFQIGGYTASLGGAFQTAAAFVQAGAYATTITSTATTNSTLPAGTHSLAPLDSPGFSGTPTVPTAALNTNTSQAASTAFVIGQAATATPLIDGTAAVGSSTTYARADHVHPSDTSRLAVANNLSDVANAATSRSNLGVTATGADTTYNYRANNLSDVASASTSRSNLGVTATGADTTYNFRANNLSDVASKSTSRAYAGLNVDSICSGTTCPGDTNYTILSTDRMVYHTALSAARTDTLPAANSVNPGQQFVINDFAGVASATKTITLQRAGSDTINGVASVTAINAQYGAGIYWSDGVSRWTFQPTSSGSGGGTVTQVACNGVTITASGTCPPSFGLQNCALSASVASNLLTVNLTDNAGNTPTANSPCNLWFRNATASNGSWSQVTVSSALSITTNATGATLGSSSSTAFRLWVTIFNNSGTPVLALYNASTSSNCYPIDETNVQSSTPISGSATSAGVYYTPNGTTLSSKAILTAGYVEYNSTGLATAGSYASAPNFIQTFGPGVHRPCEPVQMRSNSTGAVQTSSGATYPTVTGFTVSPGFTSAANLALVSASTYATPGSAGSVQMGLYESTGSFACTNSVGNSQVVGPLPSGTTNMPWAKANVYHKPNSLAPIYGICFGVGSLPGTAGGGDMTVQEIMG